MVATADSHSTALNVPANTQQLSSDSAEPDRFQYIPEIDGLRAIAVISVLVFHVSPEFLPGGFTGVDVFFVISGFLVTSILLKEKERDGSVNLKQFWVRRARRLLPTGLTVILATLILGFVLLEDSDFHSLGKQATSALLFYANFFMWDQANDYWARTAESLPLLHTWSLAVEEQFYFVLPLVIWCIAPRRLTQLLFFTLIASFGISLYATNFHKAAAFYLIPFRAWELLTGTFLAVIVQEVDVGSQTTNNVRRKTALCFAGLLLIAIGFAVLSSGSLFPAPSALIPVIGTACIIVASRSYPGKHITLLSNGPIIYVGKLSYALYLWHWPILTLCRIKGWPVGLFLLCVPASIMTYELIEKRTRRSASLKALAATFCFTTILAIAVGSGLTSSLYSPPLNSPRLATGYDSQTTYLKGGTHVNQQQDHDRVIVLGNSMAYQHAELINHVFNDHWITYLTVGGTPARFLDEGEDGTDSEPPVTWTHDERLEFDRVRNEALDQRPPYVIVSERWDVESKTGRERTERLLQTLLIKADRVIVFLDCPALDIPSTMSMQQLATTYSTIESRQQLKEMVGVAEARSAARTFFQRFIAEQPRLSVIDPEEAIRKNGVLSVVHQDQIIFGNQTHLSIAGTMLLERQLRLAARLPAE